MPAPTAAHRTELENELSMAVNLYFEDTGDRDVRSFLAEHFAARQAEDTNAERDFRPAQDLRSPTHEWSLAGWLRSIDLHEVVAEALEPPAGLNALTHVLGLTSSALSKLLQRAGLSALEPLIRKGIDQLRGASGVSTGAQLNAKFAADGGAFVMAFASLDQFFSGLEGLIGAPSMFRGSLLAQMAREHTMSSDSRVPFCTSNGIRESTSEREYEFVIAGVAKVRHAA